MTAFVDPGTVSAIAASAFVGSFLGVVVTRLPEGRSIVRGRSACDHCGRTLGVVDLIPLIGWAVRRGKCGSCGATIDPMLPAIELLAILVPVWAATVFDDGAQIWASCALGWTLLCLAMIDVRHFILPDVLTLPLIAAGIAALLLLWPGRAAAGAIGALAAAGGFWLVREAYCRVRAREGLGLGDVKLAAAGGAWIGWEGIASMVFIAALAGLAVAALGWSRGRAVTAADQVPFGAYLCLAIWIVWLYGPLALGFDPTN